MTDHVEQLARRIDALDTEPVSVHPAVLDDVHRGLLGELERLAGDVAGTARDSSRSAPGSR